MKNLPALLLDGLSPADIATVEQWWIDLGEDSPREVTDLWDKRMDVCLFGIVPEEPGASAPVVIGGRFVPRDDTAGWAEWHAAYFDYLINHPELVVDETMMRRTFHICTRHEAARATLAAGRIPADFRCPLASPDCPMRRLFDAAHRVNGR